MPTPTTLAIAGYADEPVPHTFLRQEQATEHLAILLPGLDYGCDLPLLYYPTRLLLARGADVLRVEYAPQRRADFRRAPATAGAALFADVSAACQAALAQRPYRQFTLVGKSLGTLALGHVLTTDARLSAARVVWLTPLLHSDVLRGQIAQWGGRSLFVIGTADPYYDAARLTEVQAATGGATVVVEGADHSLELGAEVVQSLAAMTRVVQALQQLLEA